MRSSETGPIYGSYLEKYLETQGFSPFFSHEKKFPIKFRHEVSGISNVIMPPSEPKMRGLRGLLFSMTVPQDETRKMGFTWEFRDKPLNARFLFLTIHHDGFNIRTCPRGHHESDLGLVINIPGEPSNKKYLSLFRSHAYDSIHKGIFSDPEARYILQDKYVDARLKPVLFIIGHGGGNPKTVSDIKRDLTEEYIEFVLNQIDPNEYSAVVDTTCNSTINDVTVKKAGPVPFFGAVGTMGDTKTLPSFVVLPDGKVKWFNRK
jgi:hypothetical protein